MASDLPKYVYAAAAATVIGGTLSIVAYRDYRAFVALGRGGLPDTFIGWCTQILLTSIARKDTTVPAPYEIDDVKDAAGPNATVSFLDQLLESRSGPRPHVPGFIAPQRQTSATASAEMKERMNTFLSNVVQENPSTLQLELSNLEGPVPAVQLKKGIDEPLYLRSSKGEIAHVHPTDGSTHAILSLADSRRVIEQGWGQRHRLSGMYFGWGYTLIYAPRNKAEFVVWRDVICAAMKYCCAEIAEIKCPKG